MFSLLVILSMGLACNSNSTVSPPRPPTPVAFSSPAESVQYNLGNTKPHNKLVIDSEITAWFIPCEPMPASWVAPIIIYHLPSGSAVHLAFDGEVKDNPAPRYATEQGRLRLESILADESTMARIIETYPPSARCPPGSQELR